MPPPFSAVMFDLDGTLLDTAPDFVIALNRLRREHQRDELPFEVIRQQVSNGAAALVTLGFGVSETDKEFTALRQQLLNHYLDIIGEQTLLFPGIDTLLQNLQTRQVHWGIATNKPRLYTEALLNKIELPGRPDFVVCPDDVANRKPHPESLQLAAQYFNIDCRNMLYLGDHRRDIECGNNAGATTIACAYGYTEQKDPAEFWQAHYLVKKSEQLPELIEDLLTTRGDR